MITILSQQQVWKQWGSIHHWVAAACSHGDPEDVSKLKAAGLTGKASVALITAPNSRIIKGIMILQQHGDRLHMHTLAGEGIIAERDSIMAWWMVAARVLKCDCISFSGRRGWQRVLRDYEFKQDEHLQVRYI